MSHSLLFTPLLLLIVGTGLCAQPVPPKLLPEGTALARVDGKLLHVDVNDVWLFELTMDVKTPEFRVPAGTRFVLLPSATLGQLIADANDRYTPRYRLSARVTRFKGKTFLFPTYYLPLSRFKTDKDLEAQERKAESGDPNQKSKIENQKSDEPELAIPPEILEQLKNQRPPRAPRRSSAAGAKPAPTALERVLVDGVGRIESSQLSVPSGQPPTDNRQLTTGNCWVFVPYALGWNLSDVHYELLPCTALQQALQRQAQVPDPIRFNVAGLVTEFQGRKYLLLQRAIVVYNYGNFGR